MKLKKEGETEKASVCQQKASDLRAYHTTTGASFPFRFPFSPPDRELDSHAFDPNGLTFFFLRFILPFML